LGADRAAGQASLRSAWVAIAQATGIASGTCLLDLGCGAGGFCRYAARRGAAVHGLDVEPEPLARAIEDVPDGDFRLGLMEDLPWPDDTFEVITAFNAIQYALDPEMAIREARRVARPEARIAICKWGLPADNEFFAFLISFGAGGVRGGDLPASDPVEDAIRATGLEVLAADEVSAPIELAGEAELAAALTRAGIEPDPLAPAETDPIRAAQPYRRADGRYRFENRLRYWVARP
jgi:SAM-dependent methyltransferase